MFQHSDAGIVETAVIDNAYPPFAEVSVEGFDRQEIHE